MHNRLKTISFRHCPSNSPPSVSYVTDRRSVTFSPQGGNQYTVPNGVKVIKINLNGDQWLDPSTVTLFYDITNNTELADNPVASPPVLISKLQSLVAGAWVFSRRMRVIVGGQIVEDIDNYNRLHVMFHMVKPSENELMMPLRASAFLKKVGSHLTLLLPQLQFQKVLTKPYVSLLFLGYFPKTNFYLSGIAQSSWNSSWLIHHLVPAKGLPQILEQRANHSCLTMFN